MTITIPTSIDRRIMERTHPEYGQRLDEMRFHRETWEGSGGYAPFLEEVTVGDTMPDDLKDGTIYPQDNRRTYLFRHPREREKFRRRVAMSYNTNVVRRVMQMISGYLTKSQPTYNGYPDQLSEWMGYATMAGDTWEDVKISEIVPAVLVYGWIPVILFRRPTPDAQTMAEQEEDGGRLQVTILDPESIIDWQFDDAGQYVWLKYVEHVETTGPLDAEPSSVKRTWWHTHDAWWYVDDDGKNRAAELPVTKWGVYPMGLPIIVWRLGTQGRSLIADAATAQRELYNVLSLIQEQERETTFAMLAAPEDGAGAPGSKKVGSDNVWWYPGESRHPPHWMAPPPHILEHFMGKADRLTLQIIEDIGLDFDASGASTGMAFQFAMSKIVRLLNLLATSLQRGEAQTMERAAMELGTELPDDARCVWPSEFDAKDAEKVVILLESVLDRVQSKSFRVEAQYRMALAAMPDLDEMLRQDGRKEIEDAEDEAEERAETGADELETDDLQPVPPEEGEGNGIPDGEAR